MTLLVNQVGEVHRDVKTLGEQTARLAEGQSAQWHELSRVRGAVETVSKLHLECAARQRAGQIDDLAERMQGQVERLVRLEAKASRSPASPIPDSAGAPNPNDADLVVTVKNRGLWSKVLPWVVAAVALGAAGVRWLMGAVGGQP